MKSWTISDGIEKFSPILSLCKNNINKCGDLIFLYFLYFYYVAVWIFGPHPFSQSQWNAFHVNLSFFLYLQIFFSAHPKLSRVHLKLTGKWGSIWSIQDHKPWGSWMPSYSVGPTLIRMGPTTKLENLVYYKIIKIGGNRWLQHLPSPFYCFKLMIWVVHLFN